MPQRTLGDLFDTIAATGDTRRLEFLVYDDGYRTWSWRYADVAAAARGFAARLRQSSISKGHAVVLWGENRPEWIAALWGCILEGVVAVPIDYRASADFMHRVAAIVDARVIVAGDIVDTTSTDRAVWTLSSLRSEASTSVANAESVKLDPDDTAEIIFTSGATAEPKGVVLTHRNILANVIPIQREIDKYRRYARPFRPIRFLDMLPLSHMFGQAMATFIPPLLPGVVIFTRSYVPEDVIRLVHERRVSVIVCVPKILEVLRDYILRVAPETATEPPAGTHWAKRWWIYRRVHRLFGFKFWAFVVGAAPLDPDLEGFWGRLGFLVVQGYGLTETAPIVTLNHPFHASRGAVGKPIAGVDVKIAADGEILVRGENVTRGYYNAPDATRGAFTDGWFHTGDIGELDAEGRLHIRGRKKEMIVTPEGLNVFPEDVERVLNEQPGVREAAVVGAPIAGSSAERVQTVLVVVPGTDVEDVIRAANARLQDHQKIRGAALWMGPELPRTEGTRKLRRRELREWLTRQANGIATAPSHDTKRERSVTSVLARFAPGRTLEASTTIEELGLTSLERVELMMALEDTFQVTIDESRFASASTVADLDALTRPIESAGPSASITAAEPIDFPGWSRSLPARALRRASLPTWILPLAAVFVRLQVDGREQLSGLDGPVIFAANHQSHLDTPAILMALPARWRYRLAPAMAKEFFKAHFYPEQFGRRARLTNSLNYYLAATFFHAFPLPQREIGTRQTLRYIGELINDGFSILIFPEGKRTQAGEINPFRPGVAMIASRLRVPVVPVRLDGLDRILHLSWKFPQRGRARVAFGAPMLLEGSDYAALALQIEEAVQKM